MNTLKSIIKWVAAIAIICAVAVFLASINGLSVSRTIATVDGNNVTESEYKYYLEMVKSEMLNENSDASGEDFWNSEIDGKKASEVAKERAMDELMRVEIAVVKAGEAGITLTEDEISSARSIVNNNDSDTKKQLEELEKITGADKYQVGDIFEKVYLSNAYYRYVAAQENSPISVNDDDVKELAKEKYAVVKHVLVMNTPQDSEEDVDTEQYAADAKKKAEEVLAKAVKGDNFEKLIAEYGEDTGMESNTEGYIIDEDGTTLDGSGRMVSEFTKGSFAVEPGKVNPELVESTYGWHIIKRYPLPTSGEDYTQIISSTTNSVMTDKYNEYLDSFKDGLNITVNERVYKKIKVK